MQACPISFYRQLHPMAEFSGKEENTARLIAKTLESMGVETQAGVYNC